MVQQMPTPHRNLFTMLFKKCREQAQENRVLLSGML